MGVDKVDLLFPHKEDSRRFSLDDAVTKEFLKSDDPNHLAKMALHRIISEKTTVPTTAFNGQHFASDLHVPMLVKEFFGTDYAGPFVFGMFTTAPADVETIQFRQDIMKELGQEKPREQMDAVYHTLTKIVTAYQNVISAGRGQGSMSSAYYYPSRGGEGQAFAAKITLLHNYLRAVDTLGETSFSSGLSRLSDYVRKVRENRQFGDLAKHVRSFTDHLTVSANVEITFNEMGSMTRKDVRAVSVDKSQQTLSSKFKLRKLTPFYTTMLFNMIDDFVEEHFKDILTLASYLGELEFYRGASEFTARLDKHGVPHTFPNFDDGRINIRDLHNPLLILQEANEQGFKSVANDVHFDPEKRIYVLTGPNDGGKSVYLRAVGLAVLLAQNGYPIPAEEATLTVFNDVYTHFIPKDDIRQRRGRYRQELQQLRYIFENATPNSLVLLDEPCGGTDPGQGSKQSLTALRKLYRLGSPGLFATHMHNVSEEVQNGEYPFAHNLQVSVEIQQGKPVLTYRVSLGRAGQSYGDLIAKDVGVDDESLDKLLDQRFPR